MITAYDIYGITALRHLRFTVFNYGDYGTFRNRNNNFDGNYNSIASEQEVIRYTKILAQAFGLNEQNAEVYSALSSENRALKKQLEDYHSQHNTLEKRVKRLERDVKSLETELEVLDECVDRETLVDIIHEIVPSLIGKKR